MSYVACRMSCAWDGGLCGEDKGFVKSDHQGLAPGAHQEVGRSRHLTKWLSLCALRLKVCKSAQKMLKNVKICQNLSKTLKKSHELVSKSQKISFIRGSFVKTNPIRHKDWRTSLLAFGRKHETRISKSERKTSLKRKWLCKTKPIYSKRGRTISRKRQQTGVNHWIRSWIRWNLPKT